jgi:hypothetical protein
VELNETCGKIEINVCWSVELAGSATVVPPLVQAPEMTGCPAAAGTHNDTDAATAWPANSPKHPREATMGAAERNIQRASIMTRFLPGGPSGSDGQQKTKTAGTRRA